MDEMLWPNPFGEILPPIPPAKPKGGIGAGQTPSVSKEHDRVIAPREAAVGIEQSPQVVRRSGGRDSGIR